MASVIRKVSDQLSTGPASALGGPVPVAVRRRGAERTTPRMPPAAGVAAALVPALLSLVIFDRPALALEFPPATGVSVLGTPGEADKRLSVFAGYAFGTDSNYNLAPSGSEQSSSFSQASAGAVLTGGNALWGMKLSYRGRQDDYSDLGESYLRQNEAALDVGRHTEKLHLGLRAKYEALEDPVDIDLSDRINRTKLAYAPEIALTTGRSEFALGYTLNTVRYDEVPALDHDENAFGGEFRWWMAETSQIFLHFDTGSVDYRTDRRVDFDHMRFYGGCRLDVPDRVGLDVSLGYQKLDGFHDNPDLSATALYAVARLGIIGSGGTSRLEIAYGTAGEQSATSLYKSVSKMEVRYRRQTGPRINWAGAVRREKADFERPVDDPVTSLSRMILDAEVSLEVGSLNGLHGRAFAKLEYESRTGDSAEHEFARLRILGGIGIVY